MLGLELGSTRIKAVAIDENHVPVSSGDYTWKSSFENGVWTYSLEEVWKGLKTAVAGLENRENIAAMGVSAMMHGIDKLICYITQCMTLLPGDIIATGTPSGIGSMQRGDTVEVRITGLGTLRNTVR